MVSEIHFPMTHAVYFFPRAVSALVQTLDFGLAAELNRSTFTEPRVTLADGAPELNRKSDNSIGVEPVVVPTVPLT